MNRLSHLRQTLPVNIKENINYPNLEFVLLDYNSTDGLENWVRSGMMPHIERGILKYYRTDEPTHWSMNHSRNIALSLATGEIVCLVDADNYAGPGYAFWINSVFEQHGDEILVTTHGDSTLPHGDQGGKMAFHRKYFNILRGFDESFDGYGMDDIDFIGRMERERIKKVLISDPAFFRCVPHPNIDRVQNGYLMKNLFGLYIAADTEIDLNDILLYSKHHILYLLKDNSFIEEVFEFCKPHQNDLYLTGGWNINPALGKKGTYTFTPSGLSLTYKGMTTIQYNWKRNTVLFTTDPSSMRVLTGISPEVNRELFIMLSMAYSDCRNRLKYEENIRGRVCVNADGWGKGTVCMNFQDKKIKVGTDVNA
ncbi:MAG: glycosyltransferase family 2 protein [Chitinophagaceae bacterium]|nr:glycosyltransferase family 2 protein [Chitinophagaceae bacterium]